MTTRRGFFAAIAAAVALDPERLLWTPGKKLISIPAPGVFLTPHDITNLTIDGNIERLYALGCPQWRPVPILRRILPGDVIPPGYRVGDDIRVDRQGPPIFRQGSIITVRHPKRFNVRTNE